MNLLDLEIHRLLVKRAAKEHTLKQLFWECTLRCNLKCRHCGSDCRSSALTPDMPFEDFKKVLIGIKEHYDPHKIMIVITGGEVLMRKDLEECGRQIYELEFPWGIVSNGVLLDQKRLALLMQSGMRAATISLDGLEQEHNWMRGVPNAYAATINAIRLLSEKQSELAFDVVTCVNSRNLCQLPLLRELLISIGVKAWRLFTVIPMGRANYLTDELQLSSEQLRCLMEFIKQSRKEGKIDVQYCCEGFMAKYEGQIRDSLYTCNAGLTVASVLAGGSISACSSIRSNYSQGNIYTDDFVDVWENRYQKFRDRSWMKTGPCKKCKWFRYCMGNGFHLRDENGELINCNTIRL